ENADAAPEARTEGEATPSPSDTPPGSASGVDLKSIEELFSVEGLAPAPAAVRADEAESQADAQAESADAAPEARTEREAAPRPADAAPEAQTEGEAAPSPSDDPTEASGADEEGAEAEAQADAQAETGASDAPAENADAAPEARTEGEATPSPADTPPDAEQRRLHTKALRFANGRTGLIGLLRQLRDVALLAAVSVGKILVRSKGSAPKRRAKKLDFSENLERAISGDGRSDAAAESAAPAAPAQPDETPAAAQASDVKKRTTPSAKNATIKKGSAKDKDKAEPEAPPLDKAAAKKAKEKEKAAAKKIKDNEKKAAKKAKDDAKKALKKAKEEAKKAEKEAKEAAFAAKYPKKAAKRAEQAAKKEAKKAASLAKKAAKPDKGANKAAKAAIKAAKKAKKEENKKPKLTKEEKFELKLAKQAARHEKRLARFERKATKIEQRLEKKHQKREAVRERKNEERFAKKEQARIRKERKREIKAQKKYWLKKGVGRVKRNISVISLVVLILAAFITGTTFLYKSDSVSIPILNKAVQVLADSPIMFAVKFLDKPVHTAIRYAAIPISYVIHLIQGEPKIEDMYFFEADKLERYEAFREANPGLSADEVVWRVNAGVDLKFYQDPVMISDFDKQPILINKFHNVPTDYEPEDMVQLPDNVLMRADKSAAEAFSRLREAAARENLNITVASAYRSYEYQNLIYNPNVSDTREKPENPLARPGFSENQSGLAFDLSVDGGRMYDFTGTPEAAWIAENAENFGFILRYPARWEDVTGVSYQPWHIRYVGDAVVRTMREQNIETLEEYCVKFVDHKPGDKPEKKESDGGGAMTEDTNGPI
ncbi:MAG: D-alanyl-D-alanine carboxypeptidase family protein, partial [Clostridiales Family XIII bacterium]|nr:D-alanyl-D-alanine carboxypeptidase family protein [Clostridiales Family XIII bacterium]